MGMNEVGQELPKKKLALSGEGARLLQDSTVCAYCSRSKMERMGQLKDGGIGGGASCTRE